MGKIYRFISCYPEKPCGFHGFHHTLSLLRKRSKCLLDWETLAPRFAMIGWYLERYFLHGSKPATSQGNEDRVPLAQSYLHDEAVLSEGIERSVAELGRGQTVWSRSDERGAPWPSKPPIS